MTHTETTYRIWNLRIGKIEDEPTIYTSLNVAKREVARRGENYIAVAYPVRMNAYGIPFEACVHNPFLDESA